MSDGLQCRVINGLKVQGTPYKEARVLFYGAGSSAVGVALAIENLLQNKGGLSAEDARKVRRAQDVAAGAAQPLVSSLACV